MSDEQTAQEDGAAVDPVEQAYEQALSGGGTDAYGMPMELPAHEVTMIGGVSAEHAERHARKQLESIQKLRGTEGAPPQQPAEAQPGEATPEPESPVEPSELSRDEIAARLLGVEQEPMSPEEIAYVQAVEAERALRTGAAAEHLAGREAEIERAVNDLERRKPGVMSERFQAKFESIWEGLIEAFPHLADDPQLAVEQTERAYEELGGEREFGRSSDEAIEGAYAKVFAPNGPVDSYGFPQREGS